MITREFILSKKSKKGYVGDIMAMYKNGKVHVQTRTTQPSCGVLAEKKRKKVFLHSNLIISG